MLFRKRSYLILIVNVVLLDTNCKLIVEITNKYYCLFHLRGKLLDINIVLILILILLEIKWNSSCNSNCSLFYLEKINCSRNYACCGLFYLEKKLILNDVRIANEYIKNLVKMKLNIPSQFTFIVNSWIWNTSCLIIRYLIISKY